MKDSSSLASSSIYLIFRHHSQNRGQIPFHFPDFPENVHRKEFIAWLWYIRVHQCTKAYNLFGKIIYSLLQIVAFFNVRFVVFFFFEPLFFFRSVLHFLLIPPSTLVLSISSSHTLHKIALPVKLCITPVRTLLVCYVRFLDFWNPNHLQRRSRPTPSSIWRLFTKEFGIPIGFATLARNFWFLISLSVCLLNCNQVENRAK